MAVDLKLIISSVVELKKEGFPADHVAAFLQVAKDQNCVVLSRTPGEACEMLLAQGYDAKGFFVKSKSCDWGPMAGFVCLDPLFNKNKEKGAFTNLKDSLHALNDKFESAIAGDVRQPKLDDKGQPIDTGFTAGATPIVITQERLNWLMERFGIQEFTDKTLTTKAYSDYGLYSAGNVSIVFLPLSQKNDVKLWGLYYDIRKLYNLPNDVSAADLPARLTAATEKILEGDTKYIEDPAKAAATIAEFWTVAATRQYLQTDSTIAARLKKLDAAYANYVPVLAMTNPHLTYSGDNAYLNGITGDYDLYAVWPKHPGDEDLRIAGMTANLTDSQLIAREKKSAAGETVGNISERIWLIAQLLNSLMPSPAGPQPNRVFHSDEVGRPFITSADSAAVFMPDGNLYFVKGGADLAMLIEHCHQQGYTCYVNNGWQSDLLKYNKNIGAMLTWSGQLSANLQPLTTTTTHIGAIMTEKASKQVTELGPENVTDKKPSDTKLVEASRINVSPLVKVVVKTEGKDASADKTYTLNLDKSAVLKDARPLVAADLGLGDGWSFLADGTLLAASAEAVQTIDELIKQTGGQLELRREKPESERELEEAAASLERDKGVRDKIEEKRKAEEKELRDQVKLTKDALTVLQTAMAKPEALINPDDVKVVFATLKKAEALTKWGGSTNESLRQLDENQIEKIVRSLGLPRTASRAPGDGSFLVNEFVARLRSDKGVDPVQRLARSHVVAVNEIDTRVESFQEEWQKKACESGFSQISAQLSIAYKSPVFKGSASANYSQTKQSESASDEKSEVVYMVGIQEVRKARVVIPPEMIVLSQLVEDQFAVASQAGPHALRPLFERHGYFVITEYTLGGKLYTSETEKKTGSAAEQASKFQKSWGVAVDATGWGGHVEASVAGKSGDSASQKQQDTQQSSNFQLSAKGGSVTDRHDPSKWIASLKPDNWEVIAYGRLIPIYEFLRDAGVREACRKAVQDLAQASEDQQTAIMNAEKRMALARWAVMSKGVAERAAKVEQRPFGNGAGKYFRDQSCQVSTNWVDVPEGMYFKGAQLKVDGDWLKIALVVTDKEQNNEEEVMSNVGQEAGDAPNFRLGDDGCFFDKTPMYIPPQQRIIGLRLRRLENPSNRVGLELKLADLDGKFKGKLANSDNNEHYDSARDCRPSASPTTFPDGNIVAGIRLENVGEGTYGFVIFTLPSA